MFQDPTEDGWFASTLDSYASVAKLSSWFEFATRPNSGA